MKELSVFIDESGDFGESKNKTDYYLVTFVFHSQEKDISCNVNKLEQSIKESNFDIEYIHTGPVIRKEDVFKKYSIDERRSLLYKMLNFFNHCPIYHETIVINRKEATDKVALSGKLARQISNSLMSHQKIFNEFDKVIVYYDNGQTELSAVLNAAFSFCFSNVEFRKAEPQKYRLFQVADFVCSIELLKLKYHEKRLSKSEAKFFYKPQELKKTFIKAIDKKHIKNKDN